MVHGVDVITKSDQESCLIQVVQESNNFENQTSNARDNHNSQQSDACIDLDVQNDSAILLDSDSNPEFEESTELHQETLNREPFLKYFEG